MREELQTKLNEKYSNLLKGYTGNGIYFEIGEGWYDIIDNMLGDIKSHVEARQAEDPEFPDIYFVQIKEKFGGLRAYSNCEDETISRIIANAENLAAKTCEACGSPAITDDEQEERNYWMATLCKPCDILRQEKRNG